MTVRKCVAEFAEAMEEKLSANDHKGGWDRSSVTYLLERLRQEVDELDLAASKTCSHCGVAHEPNTKRIIDEAADVANFAMMIADRYKP